VPSGAQIDAGRCVAASRDTPRTSCDTCPPCRRRGAPWHQNRHHLRSRAATKARSARPPRDGSDVQSEELIIATIPFALTGGVVGLDEAKTTALRAILAAPGVCGELFLGFSSECGQGAAEFAAGVLKQIASLGLNLTLDLYPPPDRQEGH
jgi:hypothetical protein